MQQVHGVSEAPVPDDLRRHVCQVRQMRQVRQVHQMLKVRQFHQVSVPVQ